jgi:signal transduction histidine kinase
MQNNKQLAIFTKSDNGRFTSITPNAADLLGFSVSDILNKTELDLFGSEFGFDSLTIDQRVLLAGETIPVEAELFVNNQKRRLNIVKHPSIGEDGRVAGIIGTIQEVGNESVPCAEVPTVEPVKVVQPEVDDPNVLLLYRGLLTLQSASSAIGTSLNQQQIFDSFTWELTNLVHADGCLVLGWHEQKNILTVSQAYQLEQWQVDVPLSELQFELAHHPVLQRLMQERSATQWFVETVNSFDDGKQYLDIFGVEGILALPLVFQERIIGLVILLKKIAERPFSELEVSLGQLLTDQVAGFITNALLFSELAEMNKSLQANNAELDAYSHTVAHDLKSPLANTMGFASILIRDKENLSSEEIDEFLNIINQNGKRMRGIIDGLLMLASVRREEVVIGPVEMEYVIGEVLARQYYTIMETNTQITVAPDLLNCCGYAPWIEEIWANYISNAIKYGGEPPQVTIGSEVQADGMIRYWIRDNGLGLSEEQQKKLFMPFARVGGPSKKGHGLGLSIVQRIVNRLGGEVGVSSRVGEGSVFYFTLPTES